MSRGMDDLENSIAGFECRRLSASYPHGQDKAKRHKLWV